LKLIALILSIWIFFLPKGYGSEIRWKEISDFPTESIKKTSAQIPPFYAWQRIYKAKGKSWFYPVLIGSKGKVEKIDLQEDMPSDLKNGLYWPTSKFFQRDAKLTAPSRKIRINLISGKENVKYAIFLIVEDVQSGRAEKIAVPDPGAWSPFPLFWHPSKDLYFFLVTTGSSTNRACNLWVFDPWRKTFGKIGNTNGRDFLSPDGKWLFWETGRWLGDLENKSYWITNLVGFDIDNEKNYLITEGTAVYLFNRWVSK